MTPTRLREEEDASAPPRATPPLVAPLQDDESMAGRPAKRRATTNSTHAATAMGDATMEMKTTPQDTTHKSAALVHVPALSPAATAFVTLHILDAIIGFLPARELFDWCDPRYQKEHMHERLKDAHGFLKTITGTCQALPACYIQQPSLMECIGPENQAFWQKKLFTYFDFTVGPAHNVTFLNNSKQYALQGFRDNEYAGQLAAIAEWHSTWREKYRWENLSSYDSDDEGEHEPQFLVEDFVLWLHLGVYHRVSDYSFLTEIQTGKTPMSQFPEFINAFEFFQDLVFVTRKLPVRTHNTHPCFLRSVAKKVSPRGTELVTACGLMAQYWDPRVRMVSTPWKGLSDESHGAIQRSLLPDDVHASELVLHPETDIQKDDFFGAWTKAQDLEAVQDAVRDGLCDWRHVRLSSRYGPQFHIGKRKKTNRWVGAFSFTDPDRNDYHE